MVVNCILGPENQIQVLCKSNNCPSLLSYFLAPYPGLVEEMRTRLGLSHFWGTVDITELGWNVVATSVHL